MALIFGSLFVSASLLTWTPVGSQAGALGPSGQAFAGWLLKFLGLTAFFLPPAFLAGGIRRFRSPTKGRLKQWLAFLFCWGLSAGLLEVAQRAGHNFLAPEMARLGGNLGSVTGGWIVDGFGSLGAFLILAGTLCVVGTWWVNRAGASLKPALDATESILYRLGVALVSLAVGAIRWAGNLAAPFVKSGSGVTRIVIRRGKKPRARGLGADIPENAEPKPGPVKKVPAEAQNVLQEELPGATDLGRIQPAWAPRPASSEMQAPPVAKAPRPESSEMQAPPRAEAARENQDLLEKYEAANGGIEGIGELQAIPIDRRARIEDFPRLAPILGARKVQPESDPLPASVSHPAGKGDDLGQPAPREFNGFGPDPLRNPEFGDSAPEGKGRESHPRRHLARELIELDQELLGLEEQGFAVAGIAGQPEPPSNARKLHDEPDPTKQDSGENEEDESLAQLLARIEAFEMENGWTEPAHEKPARGEERRRAARTDVSDESGNQPKASPLFRRTPEKPKQHDRKISGENKGASPAPRDPAGKASSDADSDELPGLCTQQDLDPEQELASEVEVDTRIDTLPVLEANLLAGSEEADPAYAPEGVAFEYDLPGWDLLDDPLEQDPNILDEELRHNAQVLMKCLGDFKVQGKLTKIRPGPVITRYEVEPAPGVKINRIINLSDDLALALRSIAPPRVAPISKSSSLGIEVPNIHRHIVYFKDIVTSELYQSNPSPLKLALGSDIAGNPFISDLAGMPHLLIAGATGSGKSVCVNTLIASILMNATPDQVRLLMVDPKMLELSIYNDIPHLLEEVIIEPKKAAAALNWAVGEMENRYRRLGRRRVRNIGQYNELVEREPLAKATRRNPDPQPEEPLPYIVIIIDELADLMMVSGNEVEAGITRLAQKARAAGIHLILATQRPSVDVITGSIKANFPCRISFKVASKVDSRTVLDQNGAEKLLGRGDMFFIAPGTSFPVRIHGCYLGEEDIIRLVEHWQPQPPPKKPEQAVFQTTQEVAAQEKLAAQDVLYERGVVIIVGSGNASISMLQRRLRIGHARAARLIDMMEQDGVVGPYEGSKAREVLWTPDQLPPGYGD